MASIRSSRVDGVAVKGGGSSGREDMLLNCIVQKDELERCLDRTRFWVDAVDGALDVLPSDERKVLEYLLICPTKDGLERLCDELFVDSRQIYRKREKALRKFTIALYGCAES